MAERIFVVHHGNVEMSERIRSLRAEKQLTQKALAKAVGVSYQTIQRWENGNNDPKGKHLIKLAECLGTTPTLLALGDEPPPHAIDQEVLAGVIDAVEGWLITNRRTMASDKKAQLIVVLYDYAIAKGVLDEETTDRYMRLVA
ncbi:MAG TPA: hypothetical protein DCE18_09710 [Syntrophobacteraceae bacterium]|nr:hypothetical protein [Syntrophobacteraceae bacterium]